MSKASIAVVGLILMGMHEHSVAEVPQELRVMTFPRSCPVSQAAKPEMGPGAVALLKVLAPVVAEKALDLAAGVAKAAGEKATKEPPHSANYQGNFYTWAGTDLALNGSLVCIVVVRGVFGSEAVRPEGEWKDAAYGTIARALGLQGHPSLLLEIRPEVSPDRQFFRLVPKYLDYGKPMEASMWRPSERAALIGFSFKRPGVTEPFASGKLSFGALIPGTVYRNPFPEGYSSEWMPLAPQSETTKSLIAKDEKRLKEIAENADKLVKAPKRQPGQNDVALEEAQTKYCAELAAAKKEDESVCPRSIVALKEKIDSLRLAIKDDEEAWAVQVTKAKLDSEQHERRDLEERTRKAKKPWYLDDLEPFNLEITMKETAAGSEFLKFVGDVLAEAKKDIVEKVKSRVQVDRDAEKDKAQEERDNAYVAAIEAKATVERKLVEISSAATDAERATATADLAPLKFKANLAYRKAGLKEPYPDVRP